MGKEIVYIISSMRSGSTLLKALLATRPDVSDLPEVGFKQVDKISNSVKENILVIKKPSYYQNCNEYPSVKLNSEIKVINLIRNPYDTVLSIKNMNKKINPEHYEKYSISDLLNYWKLTYYSILNKVSTCKNNVATILYENLLSNPLKETESIFKFIGTRDTTGTDKYNKPQDYEWKWYSDDGGEVIKTLKVQQDPLAFSDKELVSMIHDDKAIQNILVKYGYDHVCKELVK